MFIFCSEVASACGEDDKIAAGRVPGSQAKKVGEFRSSGVNISDVEFL
jgi:hypothetical protein